MLDLYATSVRREIWKDGRALECLVPKSVIGWEFYTLLHPQPGGASALRLNGAIALLAGRPPGKEVCPSIFFAYVPAGYVHVAPSGPAAFVSDPPGSPAPTMRTRVGSPAASMRTTTWSPRISDACEPSTAPPSALKRRDRTVLAAERQHGNLEFGSRAAHARLVVLCPTAVLSDVTLMPPEVMWGLYISPGSRHVFLASRDTGKIDLHLSCLLTYDSVFRRCGGLASAYGRLFDPLGTAHAVPNCFQDVDPLDIHCGITNGLVVDHRDIDLDGRDDYRSQFGLRLPEFFVSNSSVNLCFLAPLGAEKRRTGAPSIGQASPSSSMLPDLPLWTLDGIFDEKGVRALQNYRKRSRPQPDVDTGFLDVLGVSGSFTRWFSGFGSCREMTKASPETAQSSPVPEEPGNVSSGGRTSARIVVTRCASAGSSIDAGSGGAVYCGMTFKKQTCHVSLEVGDSEPVFWRKPPDGLSRASPWTECHTGAAPSSPKHGRVHDGGYWTCRD